MGNMINCEKVTIIETKEHIIVIWSHNEMISFQQWVLVIQEFNFSLN